MGIDNQSLPHGASVLVPAKLEWHLGALPGLALVGGTQNLAVAGPIVGISARREVNPLRVVRVEADAVDAHQVPVVPAHPILQRNPPLPAWLSQR